MQDLTDLNFIKQFEENFQANWDLPALTNLNENITYTYEEVAKEIARLHILFEHLEIKRGDKIALVGANHTSWIIIFLATITYGAVIVPVLPDYHQRSIENIIIHSDAKISFVDSSSWNQLNKERITHPVFSLTSIFEQENVLEKTRLKKIIEEEFTKKFPEGFNLKDVKYPEVSNDSVLCLNYISGTANFTRGVMITGSNFLGNIISIRKLNLIFKGERNVIFLPMSHAFSCTMDFLFATLTGVHMHVLGDIRNTKMLFDAFKQVNPHLVSTVPLIIEKIHSKFEDNISKNIFLRFLLKVPFIDHFIFKSFNRRLISFFGKNVREVLIGGAILDEKTEKFLAQINFPFSIGYGMTECAPFISYKNQKDFVARTCGTTPELMSLRIDSEDPYSIPGEIQVKGMHVCKGYYKNPDATASLFTEDGWLKTGDLGIIDKENRLYIKGLLKNMILGSNGQNIYPKEIEEELSKMPYVLKCSIIGVNNRLKAIVYPDIELMKKHEIGRDMLSSIMSKNRNKLNRNLSRYEKLSSIEIMYE